MRRALGQDCSEYEVRNSARKAFANYGRYWVDSFRLGSVGQIEVDAHMEEEGLVHLYDAMERGKGAILVLPHLGGWEFGGLWLAMHGIELTVVAEKLEPPELFEWFTALRAELGLTVIPLGPGAGPELTKVLRNGGAIALLSDRDLVGNGVEVEFFGEKTTLPAGPAMLAMRTGAALLPAAVYAFPDGLHKAVCMAPIPVERTDDLRSDVARITAAWAKALEGLIRRDPSQWHLFQPGWPSDKEALHDKISRLKHLRSRFEA